VKIAHGSFQIISIFLLPLLIIGFYPWGTILALISGSFSFYLIWFFRDPERTVFLDENKILAAADGTVIYSQVSENLYKVAIRMSPFDVHINRSPITGRFISETRRPGKHTSVYFSGAEEKNESNLIVISNDTLEVEVLQLTGAFARRIETWIHPGNQLAQGEKIGMIRFGSQTNIQVKTIKPIRITVKVGDKVKAGLSTIMEVYDAE